MSCVVQIAQPEPECRSDSSYPTILFHALRDALGSLITKKGWFGTWSFLAIVCCLTAPLSAQTTGTFGNFTYSDNGTSITITDYPEDAVGPVEIPSTINGKPVTGIGYNAFYGCYGLTNVSIPSGVTTIGDQAFNGCTALTSISIPSGVTSIGNLAFYGCRGLSSVSISSGVTSIGYDAFSYCTKLTSLSIPSTVTSIGSYAFSVCTELVSFSVDVANPNYSSSDGVLFNKLQTSLIQCPASKGGAYTIPSTVTTIGDNAFVECTGLTSVSIPASVTSIGLYAFYGCTGLTGMSIPSSVTTIGEGAFSNCTGLTSVFIPASVTSIGLQAFYSCTALTSVLIPSSVTNIGSFAFAGCTTLTSVSIPSSVTDIGDRAFADCTGLVSFSVDAANPNFSSSDGVLFNKLQISLIQCPASKSGAYTIPSTATSIADFAFSSCTGLTSVSIPSSLTSIGSYAFLDCTGLTGISIPSGVTSIGSGAFYGCTGLTSVSISSSVTSIGSFAFYRCTGLASVAIPSSVTSIGSSAFLGCTGLVSLSVTAANPNYSSSNGVLFNKLQTSLIQCPVGKSGAYTIPSSVSSIGSNAFYGCTALTSVSVPSSITDIGSSAFSGCTGLTNVSIPPGVTSIGGFAFYRCTGLTSMSIPSSVTSIGSGAFSGCTGIVSFSVAAANPNYSSSDGVLFNKLQTSLIQCPAGKSGAYTIPSGVISIGDSAFYGCSGLTSVPIPSGVTTIGSNAFYGCTGITSVSIPSSVTSIGYSAFSGCTGIVSFSVDAANPSYSSSDGVLFNKPQTLLIQCPAAKNGTYTIPSTVTAIGDSAFAACTGLTSVSIPPSVTYIGIQAFTGCTGLTGMSIPYSVFSIGDYAFSGCTGIVSFSVDAANHSYSSSDGVLFNKPQTSLIKYPAGKSGAYTIPADVTTIGYQAFFGCTGLVSLSVDAANPNYSSLDGVLFNKLQTLLIQYPAGKSGAYTIPASVTTIGIGAFYRCTGLVSLSVDAANPNYSSLDGVVFNKLQTSLIQCPAGRSGAYTIPSGVTSIGNYAFYGCIGLTSVTFTETAPTLGSSVFDQTASGFTVYYLNGSSGFTSPTWRGYAAFPMEQPQFTSSPPTTSGTLDVSYYYSCTATGAPPPAFSVTSGALPNGLSITSVGVISGTPTVAGTFSGTITATNEATPDATQAFTITINTALQSWRQTYFGTTANTGNAADNAVSNLDGLPNLVEYALGGTPTVANSAIPPKLGTVIIDDETYLTLTFTPQRSDITYAIEVSGDLTGAWTGIPLAGLLTMGQAYTYTDTIEVATGAPRFIRLRVSGQ